MRRVDILCIGKLRDDGLRALCDDYYRRCAPLLQVTERELRAVDELPRAVPPRSRLVLLDECGELMTSRAFAERLQGWLRAEASRLVFAIGGADGFDEASRARADGLLALGRLTLAHRLARLVLAEQLYRAVSIIGGAPYHRD